MILIRPLKCIVKPSSAKVDPALCEQAAYLSLEHIEAHTTKILGAGMASDVKSTKAAFRAGDVLYGRLRPYLNKVAIPDFDGIASTDILVFPPTAGIDQRYLKWFLNSREVVEHAHHHSMGLQMPRIGFDVLGEIEIPLPSEDIQRRIADQIELLNERVCNAKDHLATIPVLLKKFRQSVLAAACSGQLTADWRDAAGESDTPELGPIPETWVLRPFGSIIKELRNGISPRPEMSPPGVPILRISSARAMAVDLSEVRFVPDGESYLKQFALCDGDLLFTRYNGSLELLGVCGMVRGLGENPMLYPDKLMRVRLLGETALPEFVEIFFASPAARERMTMSSRSTAGQQGVSGKDVKEQPVVLPPLDEQTEIVRRVESLFALADSIESRLAEATAQVERTTQAILSKAFRGELC